VFGLVIGTFSPKAKTYPRGARVSHQGALRAPFDEKK
jgi:hypothetical protein